MTARQDDQSGTKDEGLTKEELRESNLSWFAFQYPQFHSQLMAYETMAELVDEGDGWYNVEFSGQSLYEPSAKECIEKQLENFRKSPNRLLTSPPQPDNFDKYAANMLHRTIERINEEGIKFSAYIPRLNAYYLFVFGLGLGAHLEELVEKTNCQCLLIIEPNIEFVAQSLDVLDWKKLHDKIQERGGYLDLLLYDNEKYLFERIKSLVRTLNPCSLDGAVFFTNYHNPMFATLQTRFRTDFHIIMSGLGFYFDETVMIKNTHENLCSGKAMMARYSPSKIRPLPAFIIGSGPSLDKDIEWIKENQDKAVVFSCGSAVMPLLRAGIQADFQVELENVPELYPMLLDTVKYVDVSKVHLLATTTLDARVPGFFDHTAFFFRPALSSYPLFARADDAPLHNGSPSVTNAGLALAQHFGFRDIYFFGADMGSKSQGQVHSKNAWQNSDEGWEVDIHHNLPVRGNFGGTVYTYQGMNWTRNELELAIQAYKQGRHYYNCSDGAYIDGTLARHSRSIKLPDVVGSKAAEVQKIVDMFQPYSKIDFEQKWNDAKMREHFKDYCQRLLACIENPEDIASKRAMTKINKVLLATGEFGVELGMAMTFRGSLWQALLAAEYYVTRVDGDEQQEFAQKVFKEELENLIHYMRNKSIEDLGHLSEHEWAPVVREVNPEREDWNIEFEDNDEE